MLCVGVTSLAAAVQLGQVFTAAGAWPAQQGAHASMREDLRVPMLLWPGAQT